MNNHILGDKKKSSFDDNLADIVNAKFEKEAEVNQSLNKSSSQKKLFLEPQCVIEGKLTQKEWFHYWINVPQRYMASMADFYYVFKQLKHRFETGNAQEKSAARLFHAQLIEDMQSEIGNPGALISSTRIIYTPETWKDKIIHHYDCKKDVFNTGDPEREALVKEIITTIPVCRSTSIEILDGLGTEFLQALFDTTDDFETITTTLEYISGRNRQWIRITTPPIDTEMTGQGVTRSRKKDPERFAGFVDYQGSDFAIVGSYVLGDCNRGRSRGVRYE
ncbi:hypothetical protein HZA97_01105 [Candidatus Woesearchaeota archaeon]|nr:hypothetical protein [Candidatus Woesearchaeota archaeon]